MSVNKSLSSLLFNSDELLLLVKATATELSTMEIDGRIIPAITAESAPTLSSTLSVDVTF